MKKVLLATTAVVLSAGVAAAEISVSGSARMGLTYNSAAAVGTSKTRLENRMTVNIDASTETSSGLTFGARMRVRAVTGAPAATSGARVYVKSGNLEVAAGNIWGAIDSMPNLYLSEIGFTDMGAGDPVTAGYDGFTSIGAGRNGIEAIYTAGAFTGHLSFSDNDGGISGGVAGAGTTRVAAHVAYTMNDWTVALGAQDSNVVGEDILALTVAGKIGDYGVGFLAADNDGTTKLTLTGSATFGATTVRAFVTDDEAGTDTGYGLGLAYDLGGATLGAGVQRDTAGDTQADLGVSFSF